MLRRLVSSLLVFGWIGILSPVSSAEELFSELHPIFSEPDLRSRAPASTWPEEFAQAFAIEAPSNRDPASVPRRGRKPVTGRRSRLPLGVTEGFEIRVQSQGLVTTFWVVKRKDKYDLLYANSVGSRASVSLSAESFASIRSKAARIPASETKVARCLGSMQLLQLVPPTGRERVSTFCLTNTSPHAEELRALGNTLVVWIR